MTHVDILDKQLVKIPSQKIISFTIFLHFFSSFFFQKRKYRRFFHVLVVVHKKGYSSTNVSSLKCIYSCTIGFCR